LWPEPNRSGVPNFIYNGAGKNNFDRYSGRIDYNISSNDIVFGRYGYQGNSVFTPGPIPSPGSFSTGNSQKGSSVVVTWTHLISQRSFNDLRFSFAKGDFIIRQGGFSSDNQAADLGFSYANTLTDAAKGCPAVAFSAPGFNTVAACSSNLNENLPDRSYYVTDDFSFVRGSHSLKAGVLFLHNRSDALAGFTGGGNYSFSGNYTAQLLDTSGHTGQPFADFLLGYLGGISYSTGFFSTHIRINNWGGYFQDNWKVSSKLNLQLGIRYDIKLPPTDAAGTNGGSIIGLEHRTGQSLLFPKNSQAVLKQRLPDGNLGLPYKFSNSNGLYNGHYRDIAPRIGFAYRPFADNKTVVRGGFGIYYEAENFNQFQAGERPWQGSATTLPRTTIWEPPPYLFGQSPRSPTFTYQPGELFPVWAYTDPNTWINGRSFQWNVMVQRGFATNWSLEVGYIGNKFDHGQNVYLWNRTYMPGYTFDYDDGSSFTIKDDTPLLQRVKYPEMGISFIGTTPGLAHGDYQAAQISVIKQMSHGFQMRAGYTRSRSIGLEGQRIGASSVIQDEWHQPTLNFYRKSDTPNVLFVTYVWQLPGFKMKGVLGALLGGWQTAGIVRFQSGERVDIRELYPQWEGAFGVFVKPVMTCDPNNFSGRTLNEWFNTSCFSQPPVNQFGTDASTNAVRADGMENVDLTFSKYFNLHRENTKLQFRAELFNAFNHPQFGDPDGLRGTATFGKVTYAYAPRIIQFGLKLEF
jgi:hypothetical protein